MLEEKMSSLSTEVLTVKEFDMEQVRVTDDYYLTILEKDLNYLLSLEADRLLAGFKAVSEGKDPKNTSGLNLYGGWEGSWSLLRGHTLGHYLTAMAQAYKQTKRSHPNQNLQIKQTLVYVVGQLKSFQNKSEKGYLFASPEVHFDIIEGKATGDNWVPWYTLHKIISGLVDVYKYTGNADALQVAGRLGDWAYTRTSAWDSSLQKKVLGVEYGGMNDCLYELFKNTRNTKHLAAAHKFDEDSLFTAIGNGRNVLENLHANTQIPKFVGALNRYRTLGEAESFYFNAAKQFFHMVLRDHTYITGGNSENERFRTPGKLDSTRNNINNESCNSYNMLKLARELFKVTGDIQYADYYENAYINEIISGINPETGMTTYFKPMGTGYFKLFGTETNSFWCCTGSGMENYTKLNDSIYFNNGNDLYVNMYVSSELNWAEKSFALTQSSNIPLSGNVVFTVGMAPVSAINIKFRAPNWIAAGHNVSFTINNITFYPVKKNGYLEVNRVFKSGDKIELNFPMEIKVERLPDNPNAVAFKYGPVVLSAGLGTEKMVSAGHMASAKATIPEGVLIKDYILIKEKSVDAWIANIKNNLVQRPGKVEFTLKNTDEDNRLKFTPHYRRYTDRYGIYFNLSAIDSPEFQVGIKSSKNAAKKLEATIDEIQITNDQHELVHNIQGNSSGGSFGGYNYRHVHGKTDGQGWFSYDLNINPTAINYISTKYYSGDAGRTFNIHVDNRLLVEETIQAKNPIGFYEVRYKIPKDWLDGKSKITVKYSNRGNSYVGGVFDTLSILKDYSSNARLKSIIVSGKEASVTDNSYVGYVERGIDHGDIKITPEQNNALVYVNNILIDDAAIRRLILTSETEILNIKVVAEDGTTKAYTLTITRAVRD